LCVGKHQRRWDPEPLKGLGGARHTPSTKGDRGGDGPPAANRHRQRSAYIPRATAKSRYAAFNSHYDVQGCATSGRPPWLTRARGSLAAPPAMPSREGAPSTTAMARRCSCSSALPQDEATAPSLSPACARRTQRPYPHATHTATPGDTSATAPRVKERALRRHAAPVQTAYSCAGTAHQRPHSTPSDLAQAPWCLGRPPPSPSSPVRALLGSCHACAPCARHHRYLIPREAAVCRCRIPSNLSPRRSERAHAPWGLGRPPPSLCPRQTCLGLAMRVPRALVTT
jgi:hypothetical protein